MKIFTESIPLSQAGYREKAFAKAHTAQTGQIDVWPRLLQIRTYNPHTDYITGIGKVMWEGSKSKRILNDFGLTDTDCQSH